MTHTHITPNRGHSGSHSSTNSENKMYLCAHMCVSARLVKKKYKSSCTKESDKHSPTTPRGEV
jgi:hypothetical protein